nr:hypothetical protein [Tanacetum cinerariifolium]
MADENVPDPAPTRSDDQILPFAAWNSNFFRVFTASALVPSIYIQQFWNTLTYEAKTGVYSFQLDETYFVLDANLMRDALEITPIDQAHQFMSPPSGDAIIDFVNQLGYTEIIICHFGRIHNIHQRSASLFHLAKEDFRPGNLKFIPKGKIDEVFGMPIPDELILNNIKNAPYYNAYLEMVAKHDRKMSTKKEGTKKTAKATQPLPVVKGKGKAVVTKEQDAHSLLTLHTPKRRSTTDQFIFQRWTLAIEASSAGPSVQAQDNTSANTVRDSPSHVDAKTSAAYEKTNSGGDTEILQIDVEQGNYVVIDKDQAGPDPKESHGALVGPDPEPMHDEFMTDLYPKFINDKSTEDEPEKPNVEAEAVSMVTVPIYQASSSVPPLSTPVPVIDLSPPKPASSTIQAPIFIATTTTLLPPSQQQSTTESERRDDQDPPYPLPDSDFSKRRRHDTNAFGSSQPQAPPSS